MLRRAVSTILMPVLLLQLTGCTKTVWIGPEEIRPEGETITDVRTTGGEQIRFESKPQPVVTNDTICGNLRLAHQAYKIALENTHQVKVVRENVFGTVLLVACITGFVVGLVVFEKTMTLGD